MDFVLFLIGMFLVIGSGALYNYFLSIEYYESEFTFFRTIPYEYVALFVAYLPSFLLFQIVLTVLLGKKLRFLNPIVKEVKNFSVTKEYKFDTGLKDKRGINLIKHLSTVFDQYKELEDFYSNKRKELNQIKTDVKEVMDMQDLLVIRISEDKKVLDANKKVLDTFNVDTVANFNQKIVSIITIFENEADDAFLSNPTDNARRVKVGNFFYDLHIKKFEGKNEYLLTLYDVTDMKENVDRLTHEKNFDQTTGLRTEKLLNKNQSMFIFSIENYPYFLRYYSEEVLTIFLKKFFKRGGYVKFDDFYCLAENRFAIQSDKELKIEEIKNSLESSLTVVVKGNKFHFNPIIKIAEGMNFEAARKFYDIATLDPTTHLSIENEGIDKIINEAIEEDRIELSYSLIKQIGSENKIFMINPLIREKFTNEPLFNHEIEEVARDLGLYLQSLQHGMKKEKEQIKAKKIMITLTEQDLFYGPAIESFIGFLKEEEINLTINFIIEKEYDEAYKVMNRFKEEGFKIAIGNIGKTFFNIRDIYSLQVKFLLLDESIEKLVEKDAGWNNIVSSLKDTVKYQETRVVSEFSKRADYTIDNKRLLFEVADENEDTLMDSGEEKILF